MTTQIDCVIKTATLYYIILAQTVRRGVAMGNQGDVFEEGRDGGEELLDFEFDDSPDENDDSSNTNPSSDDEILELVDVVEKGEGATDSEADEIARFLDGEEVNERQEVDDAGSRPAPEEESQGLESDLDSALEELESSEKADDDFELTESDLEIMADEQYSKESDVESEVPADEVVDGSSPSTEGLIGISEERLEYIVTRVVKDVVEKVARETMSTVAEKLITEALEALKESLQSSQG